MDVLSTFRLNLSRGVSPAEWKDKTDEFYLGAKQRVSHSNKSHELNSEVEEIRSEANHESRFREQNRKASKNNKTLTQGVF